MDKMPSSYEEGTTHIETKMWESIACFRNWIIVIITTVVQITSGGEMARNNFEHYKGPGHKRSCIAYNSLISYHWTERKPLKNF